MVHVGVDLHKRSSQLAVLMPDGEVTQQRLENDPRQLERFFAQVPRSSRWSAVACGGEPGSPAGLRTFHLIGQPPSLPGG